jgi:hypothetical protein
MKGTVFCSLFLFIFIVCCRSDDKETNTIVQEAKERARIERTLKYPDNSTINILFEPEFPLAPTSNRNWGTLKIWNDYSQYVPLSSRVELVKVDRLILLHPWSMLAIIVDREFALFVAEGPGRKDLLSFNLFWAMLDTKIDLKSENAVRQYVDFFLRVRSNLYTYLYRINSAEDIWHYSQLIDKKASEDTLFIRHILDLFSEELLLENMEFDRELRESRWVELPKAKQISDSLRNVIEPISIDWDGNRIKVTTFVTNASYSDSVEKWNIWLRPDGYLEHLEREIVMEQIGIRDLMWNDGPID